MAYSRAIFVGGRWHAVTQRREPEICSNVPARSHKVYCYEDG